MMRYLWLVLCLSACSTAFNKIPDAKLATISYEEKPSMRLAKEALDVATLERDQARLNTREKRAQASVAKSELELARAKRKMMKELQHSAKESGFGARINAADEEARQAEVTLEAAKTGAAYSKTQLKLSLAEDPLYDALLRLRSSLYELSKLELLEARGSAAGLDGEKLRTQVARDQQRVDKKAKRVSRFALKNNNAKADYDKAQVTLGVESEPAEVPVIYLQAPTTQPQSLPDSP